MPVAALLTGSNEGDRLRFLETAADAVENKAGKIIRRSGIYETAPWGITSQNGFLNQALLVETGLEPAALLRELLAIETRMGRKRFEKWGPRIIDIDILYYDQVIINNEDLKIPHPYLQLRRFTLVPLQEISPDWVHPGLHKTPLQMLLECADTGEVLLYSPQI